MLELIQIWLKWWKQIAIFCTVAILVSVIVSMPVFMPPHYMSKMVFYPYNPASSDRSVLFNEDGTLIDYFGGKDETNRFLSIANSSGLVAYMVDSFNLREHYKIKEPGFYYVARKFRGNYKAIKNEFQSIEVKIYDTDPVLAAEMVKAAVKYMENADKALIINNRKKSLNALQKEYDEKKTRLETLADSLNIMKKKANIRYDKDGNIIGDEQVRLMDQIVKKLTLNVNEMLSITNQFEVSLSEKLTEIHVIEDAGVAEKKSKPVRWLIVLATAIGAFAAATVAVVIIEILRNARSRHLSLDTQE